MAQKKSKQKTKSVNFEQLKKIAPAIQWAINTATFESAERFRNFRRFIRWWDEVVIEQSKTIDAFHKQFWETNKVTEEEKNKKGEPVLDDKGNPKIKTTLPVEKQKELAAELLKLEREDLQMPVFDPIPLVPEDFPAKDEEGKVIPGKLQLDAGPTFVLIENGLMEDVK